MIFFTMTIRAAVIGVALAAAVVGALVALIGAALGDGDPHLAVFDDGPDDLDAAYGDTRRVLGDAL